MLNSTQPHAILIFVLFYIHIILIPLLIADVFIFVLRSYLCKILGLYHVLMYVCRLYWFQLPTIFMLVPNSHEFFFSFWGPMYVRSYAGDMSLCMYVDYTDFYCLRFLCLFRIPTYIESYDFLLALNSYVRRSNILFQLKEYKMYKPIGPTARKSVQGCLLYHL